MKMVVIWPSLMDEEKLSSIFRIFSQVILLRMQVVLMICRLNLPLLVKGALTISRGLDLRILLENLTFCKILSVDVVDRIARGGLLC